ncbi:MULTISPECIES: ABC transporter substrate-binding protein [Haematobacter]|uniref:ABC transporter substrate-binding protein n=1 Tax=Haematobacter genomosp. 1 TaxID=366618 RepID=A0A212ABM5_9RHOB|nr:MULTISPECIES: ABC transporter substrate-binding protein [Haematobacter]OWJ77897.1 ABC transporter substrate-binding protein [Haematobacter genomosp. 1]
MDRRSFLVAAAAGATLSATGGLRPALAEAKPLKVGVIVPMTGPFAPYGKQIETAMRLYLAEHGEEVAGRRIELIVKDDGAVADATKRLAQELVVHDKVEALAGFGLTPLALAAAPISARAKVPQIVMVAATSVVTEKSPYIVRTSYTTPQVTSKIADWVVEQGDRSAVTLVMDYGPGVDAETTFRTRFEAAGGKVLESLRVPLQNPDFSAFLQKVADLKPQTLFVFVPSGVGAPLLKQYVERGLDKSGIRLIADGGVTDDETLPRMGPPAEGILTGFHYSAAHDSDLNRKFAAAYEAKAGTRPAFMGVAAWDGMHLLSEALKKTGGQSDGDSLIAAMKGMAWESPRGPISIDPETRDIVQNVYIRRVEQQDGQLWNVEFQTYEAVRDPGKSAS